MKGDLAKRDKRDTKWSSIVSKWLSQLGLLSKFWDPSAYENRPIADLLDWDMRA